MSYLCSNVFTYDNNEYLPLVFNIVMVIGGEEKCVNQIRAGFFSHCYERPLLTMNHKIKFDVL